MLAVVGTIADRDFPMIAGKVTLQGDRIHIQGNEVTVNRGTPALLASAIKTAEALGQPEPFGYLV
ncbi:MAG: sugar kinase, partial [Deltaproteobacteria bacterium]|nr:sugar kinase [Deltaproteobacteria bacterium]